MADTDSAPAPASTTMMECPDCGHENWTGAIAVGCLLGLLGIAAFCLVRQPAYWGPIEAIVTFFAAQVSSFVGSKQGAAKAIARMTSQ